MCLFRQLLACLLLVAGCSRLACADDVRFDLTGPKIEVAITRGTRTLPIAEVPTLLLGELLQIKANLPLTQLNHLLVIVAFLRGTTNEPPDDWFTEIDTWKPAALRPTRITVPSGAAKTISSALSTGASFDFINEASQNDGGVYSAYVGTLVDLVHLIGLMHTAQCCYIPALTLPDGSTLNTRLNVPPSFDNPKPVIVIALPPIRPSQVPDLRLDDEKRVFCLRDRALVRLAQFHANM